MLPFVSIVIPSYQSAKTLPRALDSILQQEYQAFEVIVADDHSDDDTRSVVEGYMAGDARVRYVFLEKNSGPGGARNAGVAVAKGELLAFLDADDAWMPKKLGVQVEFLSKNPNIDVIFTDCTNVNIANNTTTKLSKINGDFLRRLTLRSILGYPNFFILDGPCRQELYRKYFILISSVLIRRSSFDRIGGFNPNRFGTEDIDFFVRLSGHVKFAYWYQEQVYRYQTDNSISFVSEKWLEELLIYHEMCLTSVDYQDLESWVRANLQETYQEFIGYYGLLGTPWKAICKYRESLAYGFSSELFFYTLLACLGPYPLRFIRKIYLSHKRAASKPHI